jgi:hypothetical protein
MTKVTRKRYSMKRVETSKVIEMLLKKLNELPPPIPGDKGKPGKDGITTIITEQVEVPSEPGKPGLDGAAPEHQIVNGEIRFKNPDGTWGKFITVQPSSGGGGLAQAVTYTQVTQARFLVNRGALIEGTNIFGVDFAGAVEIILPSGINKNIIMVVKDESNNASTNNITITTENQ